MRKKISSIIVIVLLILVSFGNMQISLAYEGASSWAIAELDKASGYGLITDSIKDNMSKPITREEFAELMVRFYEKMMNQKTVNSNKNIFTDTKNPEILKAYELGIVKGISKNQFGPDSLTNREQVAAMVCRGIQITRNYVDFSVSTVESFKDENKISAYALTPIKFMSSNGLLKGSGGYVSPKETTTKEQAVLIVLRAYEQFKNISPSSNVKPADFSGVYSGSDSSTVYLIQKGSKVIGIDITQEHTFENFLEFTGEENYINKRDVIAVIEGEVKGNTLEYKYYSNLSPIFTGDYHHWGNCKLTLGNDKSLLGTLVYRDGNQKKINWKLSTKTIPTYVAKTLSMDTVAKGEFTGIFDTFLLQDKNTPSDKDSIKAISKIPNHYTNLLRDMEKQNILFLSSGTLFIREENGKVYGFSIINKQFNQLYGDIVNGKAILNVFDDGGIAKVHLTKKDKDLLYEKKMQGWDMDVSNAYRTGISLQDLTSSKISLRKPNKSLLEEYLNIDPPSNFSCDIYLDYTSNRGRKDMIEYFEKDGKAMEKFYYNTEELEEVRHFDLVSKRATVDYIKSNYSEAYAENRALPKPFISDKNMLSYELVGNEISEGMECEVYTNKGTIFTNSEYEKLYLSKTFKIIVKKNIYNLQDQLKGSIYLRNIQINKVTSDNLKQYNN